MRGVIALLLLWGALVGLMAYTVGPNIPICTCHYEWQKGHLVIVCC